MPPRRGPTASLAVGLVVLAFAAAALPALPSLPLERASQARAWSVARTMVETGDWVLPRYHGEPRLKKPPLQSWAQAGAMAATGSTDLRVAGLASWVVGLLFALGPLALGAALGRPYAGLLGSLLLCASRATMVWGASPEHDVPFAGFVAMAWALTARAVGPAGRARDAWAAGFLGGAAVLVKGPFALAFVLGTALVVRRRRPAATPGGARLALPLLVGSLLPAGLWLVAVGTRLGTLEAVADELLRQASGAEGAHVRRGVGYVVYYLGMIPKWAMPWTPFVAVAAVLARRGGGATEAPQPSLRFAVAAFAVTVVVLTAVPAKQEHYLLPALVPGLLLAGAVLERAAERLGSRAWLAPGVLTLGAAVLGASRVLPAARVAPAAPLLVDLLFLAVLPLFALAAARRLGVRRGLVAGLLLSAFAVGLAARRDALRDLAESDVRLEARALDAALPPGVPLVGFARGGGEAFDVLVAWIDRPYERVRTPEALRERCARGDRPLVLVREKDLSALDASGVEWAPVRTVAPPRPRDAKDRVHALRPE